MSAEEHARRVVEAYAKGIIRSGEVFNQYVDRISPELIRRFETSLHAPFEVDYPLAKPEDIERWRRASTLIADWLHRNPDKPAAPNAGIASRLTIEHHWPRRR